MRTLTNLVLHADPELVHLNKIGEEEVQRVVHIAALALIGGAAVWQHAARALRRAEVDSKVCKHE